MIPPSTQNAKRSLDNREAECRLHREHDWCQLPNPHHRQSYVPKVWATSAMGKPFCSPTLGQVKQRGLSGILGERVFRKLTRYSNLKVLATLWLRRSGVKAEPRHDRSWHIDLRSIILAYYPVCIGRESGWGYLGPDLRVCNPWDELRRAGE